MEQSTASRSIPTIKPAAPSSTLQTARPVAPRTEKRALDRGAHIVVGTPGRLRDHITKGALDEILTVCNRVREGQGDEPLTPERLAQSVARLQARLAQPTTSDATLDTLRQLLTQAAPAPRLRHLQAAVSEGSLTAAAALGAAYRVLG